MSVRHLGAIGVFIVSAAVPPIFAGTPDPTLLPAATTSQVPNTSAYNALNVPAMAPGGSYVDPVTHVKVWKLTSASFPTTGFSWSHDYAEGGNEVSLPLNAQGMRVIHVLDPATGYQWLIDFTPGVGVSNARNLATSAFPPFMNMCVTFSNNPATPYYAYISTGPAIHRVDIRTLTEVTGNGWPVIGETDATWLHQNEDDSFFTWMRGATGATIVGYEPASGTLKTYTNSGVNEPRIDRTSTSRSVCISMTTPQNQALFWDWKNNVIAWSSPALSYGGQPPVAHQASLRGYWTGVDWNATAPYPFYKISATPNSVVDPLPGGQSGGGGHCTGTWIQHPANTDDQWFACYVYGTLMPPLSEGDLAPGGILLSTVNGQRRLMAHLYNTTGSYGFYSFVKLSSDGAYALFTSDMNGSSRSDLFLAEMPMSGSTPADTTPPTVSITAPASGATVSATISVTANASDNVGVAGVQFQLDGVALGAEATSSPYSVSWNTTTASNGSHSLTAVARDAAGNRTTSAAVSVTVSNSTPDTTPPTVSITAPASGATVSATVTVTATASDNVGVAGVQFLLDGNALGAEVASVPYSVSWNTSGATNGAHSLSATARDAAGNRTTSTPVSVTVSNSTPDTTPPTVPAGLTATAVSSSQINLTWSASTDSQSGVAGYKIYRGGTQIATSTTTSFSNTGLGPSTTYSYTVAAYDVAGNTSAQSSPASATTAAAPAAGGLIALLHLDERGGSTSFVDSSGSNNNGSCSACPAAGVAGKVGTALSFGGAQTVSIASNNGLNAYPITVAAWFKTTATSGVVGLVNKYVGGSYNGYNVFLNNGNVCAWYLRDTSNYVYDGSGCTFNLAGFNDGNWHQVVYVVDASGSRIYLDGARKSSLGWTGTAGAPTTTQDVQLGHYPGAFGGVEYYTGLLDEVRIYNTALTDSDVTTLYNADNADTIAPTVSITAPASAATVSASVTVSATASDNVGVAGVQFLLDGVALGSEVMSAPYSVSWDTTKSSNGAHTLSATARDAAGNRTTSAAVSVTVSNSTPDTTPPTVPAGLKATAVSTSQINLSWNASTDTQSGVAGYKIYRGGSQIGTSKTTSYSNTGLMAATTYTYTVAAYDVANNTSAQSTPASATTQTASGSTGGNIVLLHLDEPAGSATFTDASGSNNNGACSACPASGVAGKVGHAVSFGGSNLISIANNAALDAFPLTVSAWFNTTSTSGVVGLVNKYVGGSYNGYNVFLNNGNLCAWYLRDTSNYVYDGSGCTFNVAGFNDGAWHQVVYVVDANGARLYVDAAQKGTLGWTGTAGAPTTTQDVQLGHYPGAFGGVEYYTGLLDEVRIYNSALSASDISTLYSADNADTTPPVVTITSPSSGANVSGAVNITATASDNVGVAGVQFLLDGANLGSELLSPPWQMSWNSTLSANGSHTLTAMARDAAGNHTTSAVTVTVSNSTADTTPPAVAIASPSNNATVSATITVTATATDDVGVTGVQFFVDGAALGSEVTTAPFAVSWNTTTVTNGSHTLTAIAHDAAGNRTTSAGIVANVSNTTGGMTVVITSPASGATVSGTTAIAANTWAGAIGVTFFVDGVQVGASGTAPFSVQWDTTTAASGSHTLTAQAHDGAGNLRSSAPVTVQVSNKAPRVRGVRH